MVEHNEPWQVFSEDGCPIEGKSALREDFATDRTLIMGASHVWLWRRHKNDLELLVQKRSQAKKTWPGYRDIPAAGHIDAGETAVEAAIREAKEEIGITLDPKLLYYIFSLRTPLDSCEIDHVYLYECADNVDFRFVDGEVESIMWVPVEEFETMAATPESYKLVPQGNAYFSLLLHNLKQYR